MTISSSKLFACNNMWRGIETGAESKFNFYSSSIEDAQYAVRIRQKTKITMEYNTFNRNWAGVYVDANNQAFQWCSFKGNTFKHSFVNLNNPFPGQNPLPESKRSFVGVWLRNTPSVTLKNTSLADINKFLNLNIGIIAETNFTTSHSCRFAGMAREGTNGSLNGLQTGIGISVRGFVTNFKGLGEASGTTPTFSGCFAGVTIQEGVGIIMKSRCSGNTRGVWIRANATEFATIFNNLFEIGEEGAHGILAEGFGDPKIDVSGNIFNQTGVDYNTGIEIMGDDLMVPFGIHISNDAIAGKNTFNMHGIKDGILVSNVSSLDLDQFEISGNKFSHNLIGIKGPLGIGTIDTRRLRVKDNQFLSAISTPVNSIEGTTFIDTDFSQLHHNSYLSTFIHALKMHGTCTNFPITCNTYCGFQNSIQCNGTTTIDPQFHTGNYFNGNIQVLHSGLPAQVLNMQFTVNPDQEPKFRPQFVSPDVWFKNDLDTEIQKCAVECGLEIEETHPVETYALTTLDRTVAADSFGFVSNDPIMLWNTERNLYRKLLENSNLRTPGSIYETFYNTRSSSAVGAFTAVEDAIADMLYPETNDCFILDDFYLEIDSLNSEVARLDSLLQLGPDPCNDPEIIADIEEVHGFIASTNDDITNFQASLKGAQIAAIPAVITLNNALSANAVYQSNEKQVNAIFLDWLASGMDTLTENQLNALRVIASQCPTVGGRAVYRAASLLPFCEEKEYRKTWMSCYESQFPTDGQAPQIRRVAAIEIFPNPADRTLNLLFPAIEFQSAKISISNLSGQVVFERELPGVKEFTVPVVSMPNGIYTLCVVLDSGQSLIKQVSINH